jgi:ABC-type nitrate/sulfonate/bicarbonate transport system ATPase subunit
LFAILGGSACGKTSLLNVIANRYDKTSFHVNGSIEYENPTCVIGYVTQNDFLLPSLTVKETSF